MLTELDKNNKVVKSIEIDTAEKVNNQHKQIYQKLFYDLQDLDDDNITNRIIITEAKKVEPKKIIQSFKQGITNCVFTPIIKWAEDKRDTAKTKKTANSLLAPTDWQVIAKAERDRAIDSNVATYRSAVIAKCAAIEKYITDIIDTTVPSG